MCISHEESEIINSDEADELFDRYKEIYGKFFLPFNYDDFPYGAQQWVDKLRKAVENS